jgi:hypothetical protein
MRAILFKGLMKSPWTVIASGALICGACRHTPAGAAPAPLSPSNSPALIERTSAAAPLASDSADRGEAIVLVHIPKSATGWLIVGRDSRRIYGITDTMPDAHGHLPYRLFAKKSP